MTDYGKVLLALRWACEPANQAARGRRLTAWQIASQGPIAVDGSKTIEEAAARKGIPKRTIRYLLAELRERFDLAPGCPAVDALSAAGSHRRNGKSLHVAGYSLEAHDAESDWGLDHNA